MVNTHPYPFILASGSPRRQELIASLGIAFKIIKPDIDETQHPNEKPLDYVQRLSQEKAQAVAGNINDGAVILAADTIVVLAADTIGVAEDGEILGKPLDADDARAMLKRLRSRPHRVYTAFTLRKIGTEPQAITQLTGTTVYMRDYTDAEIDTYIASKDPFDKAGSYAIQNQAFHPVERIEGCYNNVVGLPICAVREALIELGWPGLNPASSGTDCDCPTYP